MRPPRIMAAWGTGVGKTRTASHSAALPSSSLEEGARERRGEPWLTSSPPTLLFCSKRGEVVSATPEAVRLFRGGGVELDDVATLPPNLSHQLATAAQGTPTEWSAHDFAVRLAPVTLTRRVPRTKMADCVVVSASRSRERGSLFQILHRQRLDTLSKLAHRIGSDCRNALATIIYNSDIIVDQQDALSDDERRACRDDITAAARRVDHQLFAWLALSAHPEPPHQGAVDVAMVFETVAGLLRSELRSRGQTLRVRVAADARFCRGDDVLLAHIVLNLATNAMEASSMVENISLTSSASTVGADKMVTLRVADDGPGMPPQIRELAFEPSFTTKPGALGMGLPLLREATAYLGGAIEIEDAPTGTTVAVTLPAVPPELDAAEDSSP